MMLVEHQLFALLHPLHVAMRFEHVNWCYLLQFGSRFLPFVVIFLDLSGLTILLAPWLEFMSCQLSFTKFRRFLFEFQYLEQQQLQFEIHSPMSRSQSIRRDAHIPWSPSMLLLHSSSPPLELQLWSPVSLMSILRFHMSTSHLRSPIPRRRSSSPLTSPCQPGQSSQSVPQSPIFHCFHIIWVSSGFLCSTTSQMFEYLECSGTAQFACWLLAVMHGLSVFGWLRSLPQLVGRRLFVLRQLLGLSD